MNQEVRDQIGYAYGLMSLHARYRPAALGDGLGNIYLSPRHLDINKEIEAYAREWWAAEDERRFWMSAKEIAKGFETRYQAANANYERGSLGRQTNE